MEVVNQELTLCSIEELQSVHKEIHRLMQVKMSDQLVQCVKLNVQSIITDSYANAEVLSRTLAKIKPGKNKNSINTHLNSLRKKHFSFKIEDVPKEDTHHTLLFSKRNITVPVSGLNNCTLRVETVFPFSLITPVGVDFSVMVTNCIFTLCDGSGEIVCETEFDFMVDRCTHHRKVLYSKKAHLDAEFLFRRACFSLVDVYHLEWIIETFK